MDSSHTPNSGGGSSVESYQLPAARSLILLLPVAFLAHLAEEWFGGLLAWTPATLGYEIGVTRFVVINAVGFAVFATAALLSVRVAKFSWLAVSLAALLGLNGLLHFLATIGFGVYSPGVLTGLVLYLPLSTIVLRSASTHISRSVFVRAMWIGVVAHLFVMVAAMS